jgi:hypothetical protein
MGPPVRKVVASGDWNQDGIADRITATCRQEPGKAEACEDYQLELGLREGGFVPFFDPQRKSEKIQNGRYATYSAKFLADHPHISLIPGDPIPYTVKLYRPLTAQERIEVINQCNQDLRVEDEKERLACLKMENIAWPEGEPFHAKKLKKLTVDELIGRCKKEKAGEQCISNAKTDPKHHQFQPQQDYRNPQLVYFNNKTGIRYQYGPTSPDHLVPLLAARVNELFVPWTLNLGSQLKQNIFYAVKHRTSTNLKEYLYAHKKKVVSDQFIAETILYHLQTLENLKERMAPVVQKLYALDKKDKRKEEDEPSTPKVRALNLLGALLIQLFGAKEQERDIGLGEDRNEQEENERTRLGELLKPIEKLETFIKEFLLSRETHKIIVAACKKNPLLQKELEKHLYHLVTNHRYQTTPKLSGALALLYELNPNQAIQRLQAYAKSEDAYFRSMIFDLFAEKRPDLLDPHVLLAKLKSLPTGQMAGSKDHTERIHQQAIHYVKALEAKPSLPPEVLVGLLDFFQDHHGFQLPRIPYTQYYVKRKESEDLTRVRKRLSQNYDAALLFGALGILMKHLHKPDSLGPMVRFLSKELDHLEQLQKQVTQEKEKLAKKPNSLEAKKLRQTERELEKLQKKWATRLKELNPVLKDLFLSNPNIANILPLKDLLHLAEKVVDLKGAVLIAAVHVEPQRMDQAISYWVSKTYDSHGEPLLQAYKALVSLNIEDPRIIEAFKRGLKAPPARKVGFVDSEAGKRAQKINRDPQNRVSEEMRVSVQVFCARVLLEKGVPEVADLLYEKLRSYVEDPFYPQRKQGIYFRMKVSKVIEDEEHTRKGEVPAGDIPEGYLPLEERRDLLFKELQKFKEDPFYPLGEKRVAMGASISVKADPAVRKLHEDFRKRQKQNQIEKVIAFMLPGEKGPEEVSFTLQTLALEAIKKFGPKQNQVALLTKLLSQLEREDDFHLTARALFQLRGPYALPVVLARLKKPVPKSFFVAVIGTFGDYASAIGEKIRAGKGAEIPEELHTIIKEGLTFFNQLTRHEDPEIRKKALLAVRAYEGEGTLQSWAPTSSPQPRSQGK